MTVSKVVEQTNQLQPDIIKRFQKFITKGTLAHAYLLTGQAGIGKFPVAQWVAMRLFCENVQDNQPCGECNECRRIIEHQHPDVVEIQPDGQSIKVDQVRFLKAEFAKSGVESSQKIFIISDADKMTTSAANSLLKFIEEPTGNVVAFLLSASRNLILPTIVSRAEVIELQPLAGKQVVDNFIELGMSQDDAQLLSTITTSVTEAQELMADNWLDSANRMVKQWFLKVVKRDHASFIDVQTNLVSLAKDRKHQEILLDIIMAYPLDVLKLKVNDPTITFVSSTAELSQVASQYSTTQLVKLTEITMRLKGQLNQNFGFQGILESATIEMIKGL